MHRPLLHMKLPGMLHSLVKLFPGSSWLSVGERGQGGQRRRQGGKDPGPHNSSSTQIVYVRLPVGDTASLGLGFLICERDP